MEVAIHYVLLFMYAHNYSYLYTVAIMWGTSGKLNYIDLSTQILSVKLDGTNHNLLF